MKHYAHDAELRRGGSVLFTTSDSSIHPALIWTIKPLKPIDLRQITVKDIEMDSTHIQVTSGSLG